MSKENLIISKNNEEYKEDVAAKGAMSRWLENQETRMRVIIYPANFKGDHVCYKGHAIYVIKGSITIDFQTNAKKWEEDDGIIIPDTVPHVVLNESDKDAKVLVVDKVK